MKMSPHKSSDTWSLRLELTADEALRIGVLSTEWFMKEPKFASREDAERAIFRRADQIGRQICDLLARAAIFANHTKILKYSFLV